MYKETCRNPDAPKTKYACFVEADEERLEGTLHKDHEDHTAGEGINSSNHYNLVHKFIPMPKAMKIPDAKGPVDQKCENLWKIPAWRLTKVRNKQEIIAEARKEGKTVHFASLLDICHLKKSELEPKFQSTRAELYSEVTVSKMILDHTQYLLNMDHQHHK